jgi:ribonuclease D
MGLLTKPLGGTPPVIETESDFAKAISELARGSGPIAIDAERASGFRYSARAYLIQIFRRGGGLHLVDPINLQGSSEISKLNRFLETEESVIHAASQDLPCLREFGIFPKELFDTELGARIAGCQRVGLGPLCENLLEISLAKEHSAVDWSIRPLRPEWLDYAALDVAVLIDLRDKVFELLESQGKLDWAKQEFAAQLKIQPTKVRNEPWRRTSGMHQIRTRPQMAIIRELWNRRDSIASEIDLAPGRLLSDSILIALAKSDVKTKDEFLALPEAKIKIRNDVQQSYVETWLATYLNAKSLTERDWPQLRAKSDGLPPIKIWRDKYPLAHAHLTHARHNLNELSVNLSLPLENLLSPETLRRICFDNGLEAKYRDPEDVISKVESQLLAAGAREWQIAKCSRVIAEALCKNEPLVLEKLEDAEEAVEPAE